MNAFDFESLICSFFEKDFNIERQVFVPNRGDGRRGRIDIILKPKDKKYGDIAIEIDRNTPRKKSLFKLKEYGASSSYVFLRSPFTIILL